MPVDLRSKLPADDVIYFREQYANSVLTRLFYDFRDRQVIAHVRPEDRIILDVGCGEGITLEKLVRLFPDRNVKGVDFEPENVEICRRLGLPVTLASVYDLQTADRSVDCCLFLEVIEHLDEPERAFVELHRVLRPGGRLVLLFPHDRMFKIARLMTGKLREAFYDPGHVRQWTPRSMAVALEKAGFTIAGRKNLPFCFWSVSLYHLMVADKPAKR